MLIFQCVESVNFPLESSSLNLNPSLKASATLQQQPSGYLNFISLILPKTADSGRAAILFPEWASFSLQLLSNYLTTPAHSEKLESRLTSPSLSLPVRFSHTFAMILVVLHYYAQFFLPVAVE